MVSGKDGHKELVRIRSLEDGFVLLTNKKSLLFLLMLTKSSILLSSGLVEVLFGEVKKLEEKLLVKIDSEEQVLVLTLSINGQNST